VLERFDLAGSWLLAPMRPNIKRNAPMTMRRSLISAGAAISLLSTVPMLAAAQSREAVSIADKEGIYIDGKSFTLTRGTAKGDPSAVIGTSAAQELGPAAIVFRKGDKLYLAVIPPDQHYSGSNRREYGDNGYRDYGDNGYRDYGGNGRRDYGDNGYRDYGGNGRRDYGGNGRRDYGDNGYRDYGGNGRRDYGDNGYRDYGGNGRRDYGDNGYRDYGDNGYRDYGDNAYRDYGDNGYRDYASDRRAGEAGPRGDVGDPDYARYRLRKLFYENWDANDTK
jgi:hypothetical protein